MDGQVAPARRRRSLLPRRGALALVLMALPHAFSSRERPPMQEFAQRTLQKAWPEFLSESSRRALQVS